MDSWISQSAHRNWLDAEARRLLEFVSAAEHPAHGFAWLDADGAAVPDQGVQTWITARMTHVASLAHLEGVPGAGPIADHGVRALSGPLRDAVHGGWFSALDADGAPSQTRKDAYQHAFVLLAASSAALAGRPGARELLDDAASVVGERFWDEEAGRCRESWERDWSADEAYRGANSNMHLVEAFLAASDATGDPVWARRALRMARFFVHEVAGGRGWRLPEHFTADWEPVEDYNSGDRAHPFRPYGVTVGHVLEWARLLVHLEAALDDAPSWLLADAEEMFAFAVERGWSVDGAEGFVYTLGFDDTPVVRSRMHWVVAEAVSVAAVLLRRTGDDRYERWYRVWWDHAAAHFVDTGRGGWRHELDASLASPAGATWNGKPDVYHAFQATRLPVLPLAASLAGALAR
ncbi:AGE family epimerase/isomerase [Actinorugispora endophytica]|uniref:Mannose/cellobiose epimerase-like protein (N-acyl-D-glucosamine 2-epimerase family) n=1 Tax=Actinorugispora endophytica TaxID=1605990 RepID=A0A4R6UHL4_9ACTN|nr:AGE family epimerase/isomerase [Actinorugispora endophytica]TDQ46361.1 mannose/cellobiose epimerase-like protein (N-acyl-D-glucosamine 2-epimerase family) [Actinorugispora endophytica]